MKRKLQEKISVCLRILLPIFLLTHCSLVSWLDQSANPSKPKKNSAWILGLTGTRSSGEESRKAESISDPNFSPEKVIILNGSSTNVLLTSNADSVKINDIIYPLLEGKLFVPKDFSPGGYLAKLYSQGKVIGTMALLFLRPEIIYTEWAGENPTGPVCFFSEGIEWVLNASDLKKVPEGLFLKTLSVMKKKCSMIEYARYSLGKSPADKAVEILNYLNKKYPAQKLILIGPSQGGRIILYIMKQLWENGESERITDVIPINAVINGLALREFVKSIQLNIDGIQDSGITLDTSLPFGQMVMQALPELQAFDSAGTETSIIKEFIKLDSVKNRIKIISSSFFRTGTDLILSTESQEGKGFFNGKVLRLFSYTHFNMNDAYELPLAVEFLLNGKSSEPFLAETDGSIGSISDAWEIHLLNPQISINGSIIQGSVFGTVSNTLNYLSCSTTAQIKIDFNSKSHELDLPFQCNSPITVPSPLSNGFFAVREGSRLRFRNGIFSLDLQTSVSADIYQANSGDSCGSGLSMASSSPLRIDINFSLSKNTAFESSPIQLSQANGIISSGAISWRWGYYTYNFGGSWYGCGEFTGTQGMNDIVWTAVESTNGIQFRLNTEITFDGNNTPVQADMELRFR